MVASAAPTKVGGKRKGDKVDPLIGAEVIGQYVIKSMIGRGGMGAVYLAEQPSVARNAVIKVLHPGTLDADTKTRFENEARAASQLNHPNIVTIYNYGAMSDGTLFLAMEHLDGKTLDQVSKKPMPLERIVNIVGQIADALGEAHRRGVVHRDVKPTNVMLVKRGEVDDFVKVLDFGIAYVDGTRLTATGEICGTPTYMSPEQIRRKDIDGRSDLYSLGCVLFELVTGQVPFTAGSSLGLAYMHANDPPPRASEVAPKANVPAALDAFLARVLAKEPGDRPKHAAAFRDELAAAVTAKPEVVAPAPSKPEAEPAKAKRDATPVPKRDATPVPSKREAPKREAAKRDGGALQRGLAAVTTVLKDSGSLFRRKKTLRERLMERVRGFGRKKRKSKLAWVIAAAVLVSALGVGVYFATRKDHDSVAAPAKAAPAKPPTKPTTKRPTRRTN